MPKQAQDLWLSFGAARDLHTNFYDGVLGESDVDYHLGHVMRFVEKMRGQIDGD